MEQAAKNQILACIGENEEDCQYNQFGWNIAGSCSTSTKKTVTLYAKWKKNS